MIVVSDTSPLNYLVLIHAAEALPVLFQRVVAPPGVMAELQHPGSPDPVKRWAASPPGWLEVLPPTNVDTSLALGLGETEAICLAEELKAELVLIDERQASAVARQRGLAVTGTLGVLNLAAQQHLLDLRQAIAALRETTFRGPDDLMDRLSRSDMRFDRGDDSLG